MKPVVIGSLLGVLASVPMLIVACNQARLAQVQDASDKRRVICEFVEVWAPGEPKLEKLGELCKAGADLQDIAAAYAGCQAPEKP